MPFRCARSLVAGLFWAAVAAGCSIPPVTPLTVQLSRDTRLLVVAPHPDDEAIAAAGLIRRTVERGGRVKVVLATSGDGFAEGVMKDGARIKEPTAADFRGYGKTRERETGAAMSQLGVRAADITFLGFPDQGLCPLASGYLSTHGRLFESPFTGRTAPPGDEQIVRGVKYRAADLQQELRDIIGSFEPTLLVVPHPEDDHTDHCATYIFAAEAMRTAAFPRAARAQVLHYLVHYGDWPLEPPSAISQDLKPPLGFPKNEGAWRSLALTPDEAAAKKSALGAYDTQVKAIGEFLAAFARPNELFLEGRPSAPECWCDDRHVATEVPPSKRRHPTKTRR